ncbi:MAG TPA: cytochrome c [Blastocatellia bacterium]|nr:cytochrome c [Blastocatellia bacterium]
MKRTRITVIALACFVAIALFTLPSGQATGNKTAPKNVTFNKDVAPIFYKNCADCHRPGEAAPFSALTYKDVRPWAKSIREKVVNRTMPPWHADPHVGEWANDRRLTQAEIDTIVAWVDGGAKEGEAKDLPPAPKIVEGWVIGKPDIVIPMPEEFTLEASGPDEYQYFETDPGFKEDVYVQMAEARPGNRKIVHHIIAFIVPPSKDGKRPQLSKEEIEKMRAKMEKESIFYKDGFLNRVKMDAPVYDDGCSLPSGGSGSSRNANEKRGRGAEERGMLLCGFAPGMNQAIWEPGTVKKIQAGSKILFQMHYSKTAGSVQKDRSSIGLVFAKNQPQKLLMTRPVSNNYFLIPAGADNHATTACWTVEEDIHILTLMPHMHLRGKAQKIEAFYPNGKSEVLLNVPNYDFSWQTVYYLKKPAAIPKGTKILVTGYFDNSAKNKYNPDPTKAVRWGDPTYDEMMIGWIDYTVDGKGIKPTTAMNDTETKSSSNR